MFAVAAATAVAQPLHARPADETANAAVGRAFDEMASAARRGASTELSALIAASAATLNDLRDPAMRNQLSAELQVYKDILATLTYRSQSEIGSFFDDESSGGLFTALTSRYPEYRGFIAPIAVRADDGRVLYPTAETITFLISKGLANAARPSGPTVGGIGSYVSAGEHPPVAGVPATKTAIVPPVASATAAAPLLQPKRVIDGCEVYAQIRELSSSEKGLQIYADGPIDGRITAVAGASLNDAIGGSELVTLEIPGATVSGIAPTQIFRQGPFASARISRFRQGSACGVRIRLQPRRRGDWLVQRIDSGILIGSAPPPNWNQSAADEKRGRRGGSFIALGSWSASGNESGRASATQVQFGGAQRLASGVKVRGFLAPVTYRGHSERLFAGIGISDMQLRGLSTSAAAGDVAVNLGSGFGESAFFNGVVIRGLGIAVGTTASRLEFFGGRAAAATLFRLTGTGSVLSDITHDHVFGSQWSWAVRPRIAVSFGFARSLPRVGPTQTNVFGSADLRRNEKTGGRLMLEQSRQSGQASGWAVTIDPYSSGEKGSLSGFFRYTSHSFRPALASSLFASLRRSYGLASSYRLSEGVSTFASASKVKTFSLFDPEDVGTLTGNASTGAFVQIANSQSISAIHSETSLRTDPGASLPADSRTRSNQVNWSGGWRSVSGSLSLSRDSTENLLNGSSKLRADQIAVELQRAFPAFQLYGRGRAARTLNERGDRVGPDAGVALGYRSYNRHRGGVHGELGYSTQPPGVAALAARQAYASIAWQPPPSFSIFTGSINFSYYLLRVGEGPTLHAWAVGVGGSRILRWGAGSPGATAAGRALPLVDGPLRPSQRMRIVVNVFEDANANGSRDRDELGVAAVPVVVGPRTYRTRRNGRAEVEVERTDQVVRIGPAVDYFIDNPVRRVPAAYMAQLDVAARPAGRVAVRVEFRGEPTDAAFLSGIRILAIGAGTTVETVTDTEGTAILGPLPVGRYIVQIDRTTLAPETVLVGSDRASVEIRKGQRGSVGFAIRRATVRERFGASSGRS